MEQIGQTKEKKEKKVTKNWKRYECQKAKEHRAKHVGGPGREDYRRGSVKGEVKHMKRQMTKPEVKRSVKKGMAEISSLKGFTKPAIEYIKKYRPGVKLFHRKRRVA